LVAVVESVHDFAVKVETLREQKPTEWLEQLSNSHLQEFTGALQEKLEGFELVALVSQKDTKV
jgi:hypothetical protein